MSRAAFLARDSELSRAVHQSTELAEIATGKSDSLHGTPPSSLLTGCPISAAIIGSTSCTILSAANQQWDICHWVGLVITSVSILFFTQWVEDRFKCDFHDFEERREKWEVDNYPEGEIQEMLHIYTSYGVSESDAKLVAETLAKYPDFWVDHMLLHEIGILPKRAHGDIVYKSVGAFLAPFALPTLISFYYGQNGALSVGIIEVCVFLQFKKNDNQWLSNMSIISIIMVLLTICTAIHFSQRYILSLVS